MDLTPASASHTTMVSTRHTPQRSRAACYSCRSRKQKCDGEKPTCKRCRHSDQECTWPVKQQRGPAKGFAEALEHRLEVTEKALLHIMSIIDDNTLTRAFEQESSFSWDHQAFPIIEDNNGQQQSRSSPNPGESRGKSIMHQWDAYPLNNPKALKTWARCFKRNWPNTGVSKKDPETPTPRSPAAAAATTAAQAQDSSRGGRERSINHQQGESFSSPSSPSYNGVAGGRSQPLPVGTPNVAAPKRHGDDVDKLGISPGPPASSSYWKQAQGGVQDSKGNFERGEATMMAIDLDPPRTASEWRIQPSNVVGGGGGTQNSLNIPLDFQKQFFW